jgi:hypothetical protein
MTTTITEPTQERILRNVPPGSLSLHERRQKASPSSFSVTAGMAGPANGIATSGARA